MYWFQIKHWFSKILSTIPKYGHFWAKKYKLSNSNEIFPVSFFEGADFKSGFVLENFGIS